MRTEAGNRDRTIGRAAILLVLVAGALSAQAPLPRGSIHIQFPSDSPVLPADTVTDQSRAVSRGSAMVIDLHMSLLLRNVSAKAIHGVTLRVVAQEVALGGKGSMEYPSLHVAPGETFPARIDLQLMRPAQAVNGPLVEVSLDGVLFQDLSFYGDNRLNSKRTMTAREMEAQRDRNYFKRILAQAGPDGLRTATLESLARDADRPRLDVRVRRLPPVTTAADTVPAGSPVKFAFLQLPDSPVTPTDGFAQVSGNEARSPRVDVRNNSSRPVKYVELGWLLSDRAGHEYLAAALPASGPDLMLRPGQTAQVLQDTALSFSREGQPVNIQSISGFVSQVEFADGQVWVPNRQMLQDNSLLGLLAPSAEEQRLANIYVKKGINALVEELKKY